MSKEPPKDDDSLFEAIFTQLQDAMAHSDVDEDDGIQEELMTGIRHSLEALFGSAPMNESPQVTVVEGGKKDKTSRIYKRPELHFAPEPEDVDEVDDADVQIRIIKGNDFLSSEQDRKNHHIPSGKIFVLAQQQQTIVQHTVLQMYRIHCLEGKIQVVLDSQEPIDVCEGQSVDVEARIIGIHGVEDSSGEFYRLAP